MKIYLDDERKTPEGWLRTYTALETIKILKNNYVEELNLDHDLGLDPEVGDGYDVVLWIEEMVFNTNYIPPKKINVHSANPSAAEKMRQCVKSIERRVG